MPKIRVYMMPNLMGLVGVPAILMDSYINVHCSLMSVGGHSGGAHPYPSRTRKLSPPAIRAVLSFDGKLMTLPLFIFILGIILQPSVQGVCKNAINDILIGPKLVLSFYDVFPIHD